MTKQEFVTIPAPFNKKTCRYEANVPMYRSLEEVHVKEIQAENTTKAQVQLAAATPEESKTTEVPLSIDSEVLERELLPALRNISFSIENANRTALAEVNDILGSGTLGRREHKLVKNIAQYTFRLTSIATACSMQPLRVEKGEALELSGDYLRWYREYQKTKKLVESLQSDDPIGRRLIAVAKETLTSFESAQSTQWMKSVKTA